MCITLADVHTLCINTNVILVIGNSDYWPSRSRQNGGHSQNSLHINWIVSAWKFTWKLLFFGENTPHFYKIKNIIYSLLSPPM